MTVYKQILRHCSHLRQHLSDSNNTQNGQEKSPKLSKNVFYQLHFYKSNCILLLPEAPHALSLHWSKKIPFGPSFPESSVSQNFLPVSSCYVKHRTQRGRLNQKKSDIYIWSSNPSRAAAFTQIHNATQTFIKLHFHAVMNGCI